MISDLTPRREFIMLLGSACAWPLTAHSQQQRTLPVIGILGGAAAAGFESRVAAFVQGLKETGFTEGQNVAFEFRWADDRYELLRELATDLVRRPVSLIVAIGNNLAPRAAREATTTIPIVFAIGADPVSAGIVASLNRPGGNVTGASQLSGPLTTKRLQLLHDLVPNAKAFGLLRNPDNFNEQYVNEAQEAARAWGGILEIVDARAEHEFDPAFARLAERRVEAFTVLPDSLFVNGYMQLVALAARYAIPAAFHQSEFARAGGLMSYTSSLTDTYRQAGTYAGRILKGEKPADLPVLLPTKFEFIINLKTARTLGLTIQPGLLAIVDEVIE